MLRKIPLILLFLSLISSCKIINTVEKPVKPNGKEKKYDVIGFFYEGYANVQLKNKWGRIDINGKEIIPLIYDELISIEGEDYSIINLAGKYGIIGNDGLVRVKPKFDFLSNLHSKRLAATIEGLTGIIDDAGNEIIANQFDDIYSDVEQYFYVEKDSKLGFINIENGEIILPCTYDEIGLDYSENSTFFSVRKDESWGIYDFEHRIEVLPCNYDFVDAIDSHLFVTDKYIVDDSGFNSTIRGVVNDKGDTIVPLEYNEINYYSDDQVILGKKIYSISIYSTQGKLICTADNYYDASYLDYSLFSEGFLAVQNKQKWQFIDKSGKFLNTNAYDGTTGFDATGSARVCMGCELSTDAYELSQVVGGKWGHINTKGEEIVPLKYDDVYNFYTNKLAIVKEGCEFEMFNFMCEGGKEGAVDMKGKEVLKPLYDKLMFSEKGIIEVNMGGTFDPNQYAFVGGKWGFFDSTGSEITPLIYDDFMEVYGTDFYAVKQNNLWGLMDLDGKLLTNIKYNSIYYAANDLFVVNEGCAMNADMECVGGDWYLITKDGEKFSNEMYEFLYFDELERTLFATKNGKQGIINLKGEQLIPFEFDYISKTMDGAFYVVNKGGDSNGNDIGNLNGNYGLYSAKGEVILPAIYDEIETSSEYDNFIIVRQKNKYGLMDYRGNMLAPIIFDGIVNTYQSLLPVERDSKLGAMNFKGQIVIPIVYSITDYQYWNDTFLARKDMPAPHFD